MPKETEGTLCETRRNVRRHGGSMWGTAACEDFLDT